MKSLFAFLGLISLALGVLGVFLPLLPTTPFLLLSASLFLHSSPHLYAWLLNHKVFGSYIRNYREHKIIPRKAKIASLTLLWVTILFSAYTFGCERIWLVVLLLFVAIGVTWHISSFNSSKGGSGEKK